MSSRIISICLGLTLLLVSLVFPPQNNVFAITATLTRTSTAVPGANYTLSPVNTGIAPVTVQFTALDTSILSTCTWTFGDGSTQTFTPPAGQTFSTCPSTSHLYTSPGSFWTS